MNIIDKSIYNNVDLLPEDLSGWNGGSKVFQNLIDKVQPKLIIEVGSWKGLSSINMAKHIKQNNMKCQILCVDTWLGALEFWDKLKHTPERNLLLKNGYPQIYYQFLSNVIHNQVQDYILPFPTTSSIAAKYFQNKGIKADLIYIDASHEYEDAINDIKDYFKLLQPNGIIFGDDFNAWTGVKLAVNEFLNKYENLKFQLLENNFWTICR